MNILIGTKNPGKVEGAKQAFQEFFEDVDVTGVPISSDVREQPVNDEIYIGARNRVDNLIKYAKNNNVDADFTIILGKDYKMLINNKE